MWGCFSCHYIMHNGEINTIRGNADRMLAREETMHSALLSDEDMDKVLPVVDQSGSDSAMLDNTLEFLMMNGIDLPLAVLSEAHQPLFNYFKQLFAQVTNPPIDAIREKIVTDTTVFVGSNGNRLEELPENCEVLQIKNPILTSVELLKIKYMDNPGFRAETLDLSGLLSNPYGARVPHFDPREVYDFHLEDTKSAEITNKLAKSLKGKKAGRLNVTVSSTDRTFGTLFGSEITRQCGNELPEDSYVISCRGGGGQSFGAFIPKGLTIRLEGDANDGFGKGLSGGKLVLYPPRGSAFEADQNIIVGNVALYGATSGKAFIAGVAGERFCVRNSGASAVVEGVGDHGCEYMTGGRAVILGNTGRNFAAGMSGGIAYVLDERHDLYMRMNKGGVSIDTLKNPQDIQELRELIEEHVKETGSEKGKRILADFDAYIPRFKKITPRDYERMTKAILANEKQGMSREEAEIKAFYAAVRK